MSSLETCITPIHLSQDHVSPSPSLQTTVSWEGDQLVCEQLGEKRNRGWRHWLEGDQLHLVRSGPVQLAKSQSQRVGGHSVGAVGSEPALQFPSTFSQTSSPALRGAATLHTNIRLQGLKVKLKS